MIARSRFNVIFALLLIAAFAACASPAAAPAMPAIGPSATAAAAISETPPASVPFSLSALAVQRASDSDRLLLSPVDPETGYALSGHTPIDLGVNFYYRVTPDGKTLIFSSYPSAQPSRAAVRFLDLSGWSETVGLQLTSRGWTSALAISPDGSRLALATVEARQSSLWLVDIDNHILLAHIQTPLFIAGMDFTADNEGLMLYGRQERTDTGLSQGPPVAEFRSAQDLELLWSRTLKSVRDGFEPNAEFKGDSREPGAGTTYRPAAVFAPSAHTLYIVHADSDQLTRVDFARKSTLTRDIQPGRSWFERLLALGTGTAHAKVQDGKERQAVISPDGKIVYSLGVQNELTKKSNGTWKLKQTPLQLQAIRVEDAIELFRSQAAGDSLSLSADAPTILVHRWDYARGEVGGTVEVSAKGGVVIREAPGLELRPTRRLDGSPLLVSAALSGGGQGESIMSTFDLEMTLLGSWKTAGYGDWIMLP
jgi:hypothetical protein